MCAQGANSRAALFAAENVEQLGGAGRCTSPRPRPPGSTHRQAWSAHGRAGVRGKGLTGQVAVHELEDAFPVERPFRSIGSVNQPPHKVHLSERRRC